MNWLSILDALPWRSADRLACKHAAGPARSGRYCAGAPLDGTAVGFPPWLATWPVGLTPPEVPPAAPLISDAAALEPAAAVPSPVRSEPGVADAGTVW